VTSDFTMVPMRCTQNPTIGEEWRKDWHPEIIPAKASDDRVLIIGAGPSGLEAARSLGNRGYAVTVAEGREVLGGRVHDECRLAGLATWGRVRDYRVLQIQRMPNVETYLGSKLTAADILDYGFPRVVLATGASWRRDGIGRWHSSAISGLAETNVFTPEDVFAGKTIAGPVVIYDDDHYYMGGVLAEQLRSQGLDVTLVTPASDVSSWTANTLEQPWIEERLYDIGVNVIEKHAISSVGKGQISIAQTGSGRERVLPCTSLVLVTMRLPNDALFHALNQDPAKLADAGITSLTRIGDCLSPSTIAAAVYSGHRYAREMDAPPRNDEVPFKREIMALED
jgi:dimethylamine/trimethylamine dehydrogenase